MGHSMFGKYKFTTKEGGKNFFFTLFALRATVYITTQYTPDQLLFGWDWIINWHHDIV